MTPQRVLAIRPDPALTAALGKTLEPQRCALERCSGNVEAMQCLRASPVDVVITDAAASVAESLALATELAALRPSVRVIVLAPEAAHEQVVDAIKAHVFACFTPPFDYTEVASMVTTALGAEMWRDGIQVISGLDHWLTLRVSCHLLTADRLVRFITEWQPDTVRADGDLLMAAFREMLLNAMEHGAGFGSGNVVEVTAARTARAIVYHFKDPGGGFDRDDLQHATASPDPDAVIATAFARAEKGLRPGGFGMLIARQVADELVYNERGNEVLLIKHLD